MPRLSLLIGGVGVYEFWRWQRATARSTTHAKVFDTAMTALDNKDLPAAKSAFAQLGEGKGGFAALANHMLAGVEKDLTNDKAAIEQASRRSQPPARQGRDGRSRDAEACLRQGRHGRPRWSSKPSSTPLVDKGGQAGALARELVAAKVLAAGDVERARAEYQALSLEIDAPQQMQAQRVSQALATLPPKSAATAPAAPAPAAHRRQPPAQPPAQPGQQ